MRLVADSGSTKTSWVLIREKSEPFSFNTEGFNPFYVDSNYIINSIKSNFPIDFPYNEVKEVFFYGAGCTLEKIGIVENALLSVFKNASSTVLSDLYAAAKALIGDDQGFVSILGTGTNTALFNEGEVKYQIPSLGFLLGDEGSGAYIGRKLLALYGKGLLPDKLEHEFNLFIGYTPNNIISHFYEQKLPNRFSASIVPFILKNLEFPIIKRIVIESFRDFFKNIVSHYPNYQSYSLNVMGSIAFNFQPILSEVAAEFGMPMGKIYRSPMEGLICYHS